MPEREKPSPKTSIEKFIVYINRNSKTVRKKMAKIKLDDEYRLRALWTRLGPNWPFGDSDQDTSLEDHENSN